MKVHLKHLYGPYTIENVTKIEFVTKIWEEYPRRSDKTTTRVLIYVNDEPVNDWGFHLDDLIKIEQEG